eukprot:GHVR01187991.1.p1 GENE.GHVR01187991.1~~GHVR01187991.1.p1  ORF type:complete len:147 (+),score=37.30 GHVR01187991.1:158-598(+)
MEEDRLHSLEKEVKRLKAESVHGSVDSALQQVRHLADKLNVDNNILLSSVEQLSDAAMLCGHPERDAYKHYLRACRQLEDSPQLRKLGINLLGDSTAKRVSNALEAVRKADGSGPQGVAPPPGYGGPPAPGMFPPWAPAPPGAYGP